MCGEKSRPHSPTAVRDSWCVLMKSRIGGRSVYVALRDMNSLGDV